MPTLPIESGSTGLGGGDLPATSDDDIKALLPAFVRRSDSAPVRDAIAAALRVVVTTYCRRAEDAAALSDVLNSRGDALISLAEDFGVFVVEGDSDETLRARILDVPSMVTPEAIMAAVSALVAPHSNIRPAYFESVPDRWYVGTSAARTWHSFLYGSDANDTPSYPDRLYPADASLNAGIAIASRRPGGAIVFSGVMGRCFGIRIPDLGGVDQLGAYVRSAPTDRTAADGRGWFVGTGASALNTSFLRSRGASALDLYAAIVRVVTAIKGHGILWTLLVDPKLT